MKFIKRLLIILLLCLIVWIDLPDGGIGHTALKSPSLAIKFGNVSIKRDFKTHLGLDLQGGSHLVFEANMKEIKQADRGDAIESARNIIEQRVNYFGISEPSVQTVKSDNSYRVVVDLPGNQNISQAVGLIGQTARLEFTEMSSPEAKIASDTPLFFQVNKKTGLTGKNVKKSRVDFDQKGRPAVSLEFDGDGAKMFEAITKRNVGRPVGIFLDNMPLSIPTVQEAISGGRAVITGDFTVAQAKQLSIAINSGALPVSIKIIEQRNIGPTLGAVNIKQSIFAGVVGLSAVILFMVLYYGRLGVVACVGLLLYGLITLVLFRVIPVVLTLPGVAGFILSIGMAVDANILIFERIKEETRRGKPFEIAKNLGFGRAIDAIKDANLTTILVAFILFNPLNWNFFPQFGLIRGFALTLAIGVGTSLFTGVFITKRLIDLFFKNKKNV